ncbi:MAG: hypothetical protein AAFU53_03970 [Cyanobacteria bacterium J06632_3]
MKRYMLSALTTLTVVGLLTTTASARQVSLGNPVADLNGDGTVTLHELFLFNRDQRDKR